MIAVKEKIGHPDQADISPGHHTMLQ